MNLKTIKQITLHRATFDMYEVIALCNAHLDNDNIAQAIGMGFIIIEAIVENKINCIYIKDVFHMPKFHVNLHMVSKFVSNGLKVHFNLLCKSLR